MNGDVDENARCSRARRCGKHENDTVRNEAQMNWKISLRFSFEVIGSRADHCGMRVKHQKIFGANREIDKNKITGNGGRCQCNKNIEIDKCK